jgi:ribonuclease HIII
MTISPNAASQLAARVEAIAVELRAAGLSVGAPRPIDYGLQFPVSDGTARLTINVYRGKKGISVVVGGPSGAPLRARVEAALESAPAPAPRILAGSAPATAGAQGPFGPGPWIGSDESGKGDYFGPLVAAAVYVATDQETALRAAGVRDSKLLDDTAARRAATAVRRLCDARYAEVILVPAEYNRLYAGFKADGENLNHLLAWGHVHVLDALLGGGALPPAPAATVIADRFADERYVRERLQRAMRERQLPMPALVQVPRAEANVAVAAASILARDRFLGWLESAGQHYGLTLPKGGSKPEIVSAARRIVAHHGPAELDNVAKLHFATTQRVLDAVRR